MKTTFKTGMKVASILTGRVSTIRTVKTPSKEFLKNKPGNWCWLYFYGSAGGFCSEYYRPAK